MSITSNRIDHQTGHKSDTGLTYCVIGAGSSGLVGAKRLLEQGISVEVIDRDPDVGGNWNYGAPSSRVFKSTHLVSSKDLTQYLDFPMPDHYPDYPSHFQVQEYFRDYARTFSLYDHIRFNTSVEQVDRLDDGRWSVSLDTGETSIYDGVVIANGHNWQPKSPTFDGHFDGEIMHSATYRVPDIFEGKRVLVIGAGNSGCDIACEAAQTSNGAFLSVRRGYHFVPKYLFGRPADQMAEIGVKMRTPMMVRRWLAMAAIRLTTLNPKHFGMPKPDHKLWESHLINNTNILHYFSHGDLSIKPAIRHLDGKEVVFTDGSTEQIDLIVCATGYVLSIPFIDPTHLNWVDKSPELYLNMMHPTYDNLFVLGLMQPSSGQWQIVDYQAQAVAGFVRAQVTNPAAADRVKRLKEGPSPDLGPGLNYVNTSRHFFEIEHGSYRRYMKRLISCVE